MGMNVDIVEPGSLPVQMYERMTRYHQNLL